MQARHKSEDEIKPDARASGNGRNRENQEEKVNNNKNLLAALRVISQFSQMNNNCDDFSARQRLVEY